MSKETQRSSDRFDWDVAAADALEQARQMAPGPERNEALKQAIRRLFDSGALIELPVGMAAVSMTREELQIGRAHV